MSTVNQDISQIESGADRQSATRVLHLYKESPSFANGFVSLSARLECMSGKTRRICFNIPEEFFCMTTDSIEPFLIASVFFAMQEKTTLYVRGQVSHRLLHNLQQFQSVWHCWKPLKYAPFEIVADSVSEPAHAPSSKAVAGFSGGVDSTYTVWKHTLSAGGFRKRNLEAGLFVHGFDIPLEQDIQFARAASRARETLQSAGIKLLTMKSNLFDPDWEMSHGAALAACLTLLKAHFGEGLIASTFSYQNLYLPWGSNPITDPLLSSCGFDIVHDGTEVSRNEKQVAISQWAVGYNNLRVCYEAADRDENCCRCGKCLMMYASLQALSLPIPASFDQEITSANYLQLINLNEAFSSAYTAMADNYRRAGFSKAEWFGPFKRCADYNRRRIALERPLLNRFADRLRKVLLQYHSRRGP